MSKKWSDIFRIYPLALFPLPCYLEAGQGFGKVNRIKKLWQRGRERFGGKVELQMPGRALLWRKEVVCSGCEQI